MVLMTTYPIFWNNICGIFMVNNKINGYHIFQINHENVCNMKRFDAPKLWYETIWM